VTSTCSCRPLPLFLEHLHTARRAVEGSGGGREEQTAGEVSSRPFRAHRLRLLLLLLSVRRGGYHRCSRRRCGHRLAFKLHGHCASAGVG